MADGNLWRSTMGTVHIERPDGAYWCGFKRQPKHESITAAMMNVDDFWCTRCRINQEKAGAKA